MPMSLKPELQAIHAELTDWRRDLHAHPETAFEEVRTADFVARKLESFGIAVHRGLATTGVVGTLKGGAGDRVIVIRADIDALALPEENSFDHKSRLPGKMKDCGNDGKPPLPPMGRSNVRT